MRAFHDRLCAIRVLDPACGTANFLYVALELVKRLEGEVLEALSGLGGQEALTGLEGHSVDPRQFLGLEINPRAVAIAELVLWIGHLQWQLRSGTGMPNDPVLKAYGTIEEKDAVLDTRAGPRRPDWPSAECIVGNPPFIGGKDLRARLGPERAEALWRAHRGLVPESADFVMYWWDHAAELLTRRGTVLRRFGFVTTNSITQVFARRVMARHLRAETPIHLVMAVPDHPWTRASPDAAAVRIAMTVAEAGRREGVLREVVRETALDTDTPLVALRETRGTINADLTLGANVAAAVPLRGNAGLCSPGVKLHGAGFIVTPAQARHLGLGRRPGLERHIRAYRNGHDLTARPRGLMVIDLFGLSEDEVRDRYPEVYQHVLRTVKPARDANNRETYRRSWWVHGEPRGELRPVLAPLPRYVATVETSKHRVFQFLDAAILADNMLVAIGTADAFDLGVLSSRIHEVWALASGGTLEDRPRYSKSRTFDPFPFPAADDLQKHRIRGIAEDLDAHRKRVLDTHPHLTLTGLYNVLEGWRAGTPPARLAAAERRIFDDGLVLILKEMHNRLDAAVAGAYGWPADLVEEDILGRLVALNRERAGEEVRGLIRWLRPDHQVPRFGSSTEKAALEEQFAMPDAATPASVGQKPLYPTDDLDQTIAVWSALAAAAGPLDAASIAATFRQGRRIVPRIAAVLAALVRIGRVATRDGIRFAIRRAA